MSYRSGATLQSASPLPAGDQQSTSAKVNVTSGCMTSTTICCITDQKSCPPAAVQSKSHSCTVALCEDARQTWLMASVADCSWSLSRGAIRLLCCSLMHVVKLFVRVNGTGWNSAHTWHGLGDWLQLIKQGRQALAQLQGSEVCL